jgi:hypothetical protein
MRLPIDRLILTAKFNQEGNIENLVELLFGLVNNKHSTCLSLVISSTLPRECVGGHPYSRRARMKGVQMLAYKEDRSAGA